MALSILITLDIPISQLLNKLWSMDIIIIDTIKIQRIINTVIIDDDMEINEKLWKE